jgi:hypothetical protein
MFQDQLLDLKKVQAWLDSRGNEAWEWSGAASSLLQVRGSVTWLGLRPIAAAPAAANQLVPQRR